MNGAKTNDNEYACEYTAAAAAVAVGSMGVVVVVRCSVFPNGWSSNVQLDFCGMGTREVSLQPTKSSNFFVEEGIMSSEMTRFFSWIKDDSYRY